MVQKFIIVNEDGKPMSFHGRSKQLCFVNEDLRSRFYLRMYTKSVAQKHIDTTIRNRKKWNMFRDYERYKMIRVKA